MKTRVLVLLSCSSRAPVFAADATADGAVPLATPMGDFPIAFVFKADGTTLTAR